MSDDLSQEFTLPLATFSAIREIASTQHVMVPIDSLIGCQHTYMELLCDLIRKQQAAMQAVVDKIDDATYNELKPQEE